MSVQISFKSVLISMLCSFILGAGLMYQYGPTKERLVVNQEYVTIAGKETRTSTITYVPKPTESSPDAKFTFDKTKVNIEVNGKKYAYDLVNGETHKFDKGQLVVTQTADLKMDIKVPKQQYAGEWRAGVSSELNDGIVGVTIYPLKNKDNGIFIDHTFNPARTYGGVSGRF